MANRNLGSLLRRNPQLVHFHDQARILQHLQKALQAALPPELAQHCHVAALDQGVLTLHTDSPAWAARLRFLTADLLKIAADNRTANRVHTIRVKARPPETKPQTARPGPKMSPQTARFLRDMADSLEDDELRASLLRLSEN